MPELGRVAVGKSSLAKKRLRHSSRIESIPNSSCWKEFAGEEAIETWASLMSCSTALFRWKEFAGEEAIETILLDSDGRRPESWKEFAGEEAIETW